MIETLEQIPDRMVNLVKGQFIMGSDHHYPEEAPANEVSVGPFQIDKCAVSNRDFAKFIAASEYVTTAEKIPSRADYIGMPDDFFQAGSLVFFMPDKPVPLNDPRNWWRFVEGACWKHPEGPDSNLVGREDHPVVHVSHADARAYAHWTGKTLPTEIEWEFAAKAGSSTSDKADDTRINIWRGSFPYDNSTTSKPPFSVAVDAFEANQFGLFNMIGNVWEWTADSFASGPRQPSSCCPNSGQSVGSASRVIKGGSFLCAPSYCRRYRPAARVEQDELTSTSHIGFRCVKR